MTKQPSSDELAACEFVEVHLGVELAFADNDPHYGRVDYIFTTSEGRTAAMEVTRLTNQDLRQARSAYSKHIAVPQPASMVTCCWSAMVDEKLARYRGLPQRLEPHLAALEENGRPESRIFHVGALLSDVRTRTAATALARESVTFVQSHPELCSHEGDGHQHVVAVNRATAWAARGSDAALALIEEELSQRLDNLHKISEAEVDVGHLFLWIDAGTDLEIARPLLGGTPAEWDHFQLPSRAPTLPAPIKELWVVYEGTSVGWHWDSSAWYSVR